MRNQNRFDKVALISLLLTWNMFTPGYNIPGYLYGKDGIVWVDLYYIAKKFLIIYCKYILNFWYLSDMFYLVLYNLLSIHSSSLRYKGHIHQV